MIDLIVCSDVENDQQYVELRWNNAVFAEVWFDRDRGAFAVAFYRTGSETAPLNNAPDLYAAIPALDQARQMLGGYGMPAGA